MAIWADTSLESLLVASTINCLPNIWLQEYAQKNVALWGLTVSNEPTVGYCLELNSTLERDFVKLDLGPALAEHGFDNLKVMIFDDDTPHIEQFATTVLSDKGAAKYVAGVAFHWYQNQHWNRSSLENLAKHFQDKFLLSTEACEGNFWESQAKHVSLGNWISFDRYADDIIKVYILACTEPGFDLFNLN